MNMSQVPLAQEHKINQAGNFPKTLLADPEGVQSSYRAQPANRDILRHYLKEISRHQVLSQDEERRLTRLYRETGDQEAQHQLVTANLRLVVKIASRLQNRSAKNLTDLIQEGNLGLLRATALYDPYRGVKFSYYASYWIKAYMYKFILDNWKLVRIGNTEAQRKLFFNLFKEKKKFRAMGCPADSDILAQRLKVKKNELVEMEQCLETGDLSLQSPIDSGSNEIHLNFVISDSPSVEELLAYQEYTKALRHYLKKFRRRLDARERDIIDLRLLAEKPMTLKGLGEFHGVSRERIRQLEKRLLERLRQYLLDEMPEIDWHDHLPVLRDN